MHSIQLRIFSAFIMTYYVVFAEETYFCRENILWYVCYAWCGLGHPWGSQVGMRPYSTFIQSRWGSGSSIEHSWYCNYFGKKIFVLFIDMGMLYWLQKMVIYFVISKLKRIESILTILELRNIKVRYYLFLTVTHMILFLNLIWIILRCFVGHLTGLYNTGGIDIFDLI